MKAQRIDTHLPVTHFGGRGEGGDSACPRTPTTPPPPAPVGGWWVRADLSVQRTKAKAQSATTLCGTELVCAAMQREKH